MQCKDKSQFELLKSHIENLNQPLVMLNIMHTRTDLDALEVCEIEQCLKAVEALLQKQKHQISQRLAFILGEEFNEE